MTLLHFIQNTLALLDITQIGRRITALAIIVIADQRFQRSQLLAQLGSIIHVSRLNIFFPDNGIRIRSAVIGHRNIKFRQFSIYRRKRMFYRIPIFIFACNRRNQRPRNLNLHIVLDTGLQQTLHVDKVVVCFRHAGHARRIPYGLGVFRLAGYQVVNLYRFFLKGFAAVFRRYINMAHGSRAAVFAHNHLLVVLQVQIGIRTGID